MKLNVILILIIIALLFFIGFAFKGFGLGGGGQGTKGPGKQIEEDKIPLITIKSDEIYVNGELVSKDNLEETFKELANKTKIVEIDSSEAKRTTYLEVKNELEKLNLTIIDK
ncbi:hypothetical protein [Petrotoga sp. Shatin.DS.tank11.9.2.9.3]|jgi:biopolymer transport protein ExbD|uniref:hypothetical protein n=1 Tax=Petrotoga sp. Shatin.DS.tank11.9.2.9.3 TaxID=1469556 RepID=UPI000EF19CD0|nr:hypothetical protein [Petrotoga sp. Shatin.DS.tank11.9.2.9.3]RLL83191.1 hypothetical protein BZ25_06855 [Petrotoga sp. Shatin.DS.tank11.9.2.9.3]